MNLRLTGLQQYSCALYRKCGRYPHPAYIQACEYSVYEEMPLGPTGNTHGPFEEGLNGRSELCCELLDRNHHQRGRACYHPLFGVAGLQVQMRARISAVQGIKPPQNIKTTRR